MNWIEQLEPRRFFSVTHIGISGGRFFINGVVTHAGSALQGLLPNARLVNATFDDRNPATQSRWAYPDTGVWDPERHLNEFIAAIPAYRAKGLRAVTLSFQGGVPRPGPLDDQPWDSSAFLPDGTLRGRFASQMRRAISALDANGMVAFVQFFYFGQDQRLRDKAAVIRATDAATDLLLSNNFTNVIVEVVNEADNKLYHHGQLTATYVTELMQRVRTRSGGRLKVAASLSGGKLPDAKLVNASDVVLLHGNGQTAAKVSWMVQTMRARTAKPIVFNEDSTNVANFDAATLAGASWGYYDQGANDYRNGFQSVPVRWTLDTVRKRAFFDKLYTHGRTPRLAVATAPAAVARTTAPAQLTARRDGATRPAGIFAVAPIAANDEVS